MNENLKRVLVVAAWIALPTVVVGGFYAGRYLYRCHIRRKVASGLISKGYDPQKVGAKVKAMTPDELAVIVAYLHENCPEPKFLEAKKLIEGWQL